MALPRWPLAPKADPLAGFGWVRTAWTESFAAVYTRVVPPR
jgi:hypothetical protein